jgi:hypothetical protein
MFIGAFSLLTVWLLRFQRIYRSFIAAAPAIVHVSNLELQDNLNGMLPAGEKIVLVLEAIGDDKIRVNSSSLDHPLTILPDQAIEIGGIEKKVTVGRVARSAYWLNHDPSGLVEAAYGPATK